VKWLGENLGYKTPEDWYKVNRKDIIQIGGKGGSTILSHYSVVDLPKLIYPNYDWKPWLFFHSYGFWLHKENHIEYLQWLEEKLGYKSPRDWYNISTEDIKGNGGRSLFLYYDLFDIPKLIYQNYDWKPWLFSQCKWNDDIVKLYLKWLGEKLEYNENNDWYKISQKDFMNNHGWGLLTNHHNSSPLDIVKKYIMNDCKEWLFNGGVPNGFWKYKNNRLRYMYWLGKVLGYTKIEDWYGIEKIDFEKNKGTGLLCHCYKSSPSFAVVDCFPDYSWNIDKFYEGMRKQKLIFAIVKKFFGLDADVFWNYKHPDMRFVSGRKMEIDIFVPNHNLAIEFQGEQHFFPKWGNKNLVAVRHRDIQKRKMCKKLGISLIEVDYTWDGNENYVNELISEQLTAVC
jgi:hypothetical protein